MTSPAGSVVSPPAQERLAATAPLRHGRLSGSSGSGVAEAWQAPVAVVAPPAVETASALIAMPIAGDSRIRACKRFMSVTP